MSRQRRRGFVGCLAFAAIALAVTARAQTPAPSENAFSSINENLTAAADRALATALANRSWMKAEGPSAMSDKSRSIMRADSSLKLRAAIDRVNGLRPVLEPILSDEGVPVELSAVVLVESGGLPKALSRKGARGLWQFMPDTARRYGLAVDGLHDERLDVVKSTHAAARYLRDLRFRFGDWRLALAAYDAGELAVSKAIARSQSHDVGSIADSQYLPLETRNYVPAIGAAVDRLQYNRPWSGSNDQTNQAIVYASSSVSEK